MEDANGLHLKNIFGEGIVIRIIDFGIDGYRDQSWRARQLPSREMTGVNGPHAKVIFGKGITICIIDTGVD
ncbi:hypothetical protein FRC09_004790 [Ceratobasidium sp. 395]|nr:hypothetical protein FRC09_004790 [Ceratobasidium sp. 395]